MPSAAPSRLTVALSLVILTALAITVGLRGGDRGVEVELSRAAIIEPSPPGDVVPASASATDQAEAPTDTAAPTTAPPTTAPATTAPPAPAPTPAPRAAAPTPAPTPTTAPPTTSAPAPAPAPASSSAGSRNTGCESSMMRWMNEARATHRLRSLTSDGSIHSIALGWTDRMVQRQDLSHNPDYGQQIFAARPEAGTAGENVGRGTGTERGLFDAFMASSGHRSKILGSQYSHATVACVNDAGGQLWVTMNFWG